MYRVNIFIFASILIQYAYSVSILIENPFQSKSFSSHFRNYIKTIKNSPLIPEKSQQSTKCNPRLIGRITCIVCGNDCFFFHRSSSETRFPEKDRVKGDEERKKWKKQRGGINRRRERQILRRFNFSRVISTIIARTPFTYLWNKFSNRQYYACESFTLLLLLLLHSFLSWK